MLKGETLVDVHKRFTHIVNHLKALGKVFEEGLRTVDSMRIKKR